MSIGHPLPIRKPDPLELPERLRVAIEASRPDADRNADVPLSLAEQLRDSGAFQLLTPREFGGYETPLPTLLDVYEEFGRIDASVGWLVWNANFGFMAAYLKPSGIQRIWAGENEPVFANAGVPGAAEEVEGGYRMSGRWKIVSGIRAAQWLVTVGIVTRDGRHVLTESDAPRSRPRAAP